MAGHSQFKNIMHRKGAQDKKRAKLFSKLSREITIAVKTGAPDPSMNPRLRLAISAARAANMPKDNIDRAVKKGVGDGDDSNYFEMRYEGYGPGGIAIIVEALTDNKNRTASDVRSTFTKYGGNLGETNSVAFMFERMGEIAYAKEIASHDEMFEKAIEAGADNIETSSDEHIILCDSDNFNEVREYFEQALGTPPRAGLVWKPKTLSPVAGDEAVTLMKFIEVLEDFDDVQNVYANFDISEEELNLMMESA